MNVISKTAGFIFFCLLVTELFGCAGPIKQLANPNPVIHREEIDEKPVLVHGALTRALVRLGEMANAYDVRRVSIQAVDIYDRTVPLQAAVTSVVPRNLNRIAEGALITLARSGRLAVLTTPYGIRQGMPALFFEGGPNQIDRTIKAEGYSSKFGAHHEINSNYSAGFRVDGSQRVSIDRIGSVYNLSQMTKIGKTGIDSVETQVDVLSSTSDAEGALSLLVPVLGRGYTFKNVGKRHEAAIESLKYSLLVLMGRYWRLPYWHLLPGGAPDTELLAIKRAEVEAWPAKTLIRELQSLMNHFGCRLTTDGIAGPKTHAAAKKMIRRFRISSSNTSQSASQWEFSDIYLKLYWQIGKGFE